MIRLKALTVGPLGTRCYILFGDEDPEKALIVDPGDDANAILGALGNATVAGILLTHGHFDHTGALHAFAGTPIYMHPSDDVMLLDSYWSVGNMMGDNAPRPAATDYVREGQRLHLAGLDILVMHTPGHTLGSVTFFDKEHHYGFSGDASAPPTSCYSPAPSGT
jgi:glyoxylase-like metal-dependent hydrolase (beta-lactamase superfamily II)